VAKRGKETNAEKRSRIRG